MADEEMKKARYHEMLRSDLRQFLSRSSCKMLEDMIVRAREREIDLEMERKGSHSTLSVEGSGKRPRYLITGREANMVVAAVAGTTRCTRVHAERVVLAASSAVIVLISAEIVLLPPSVQYLN